MQITHDNDCEHRLGHDCTCGALNHQRDLAAARAEIERLKREVDVAASAMVRNHNRAEKAEAERDGLLEHCKLEEARGDKLKTERNEARAQVVAAYDVSAEYIETVPLEVTDRQEHAKAIRAKTPADAQAALEAYDREKVREGMRRAAEVARKCWNDPQCEADAEYIPNTILAEMEALK